MANYLTKDDLRKAIEAHRAGNNTLICSAAVKIGQGLTRWLAAAGYTVDDDEIMQEAVVAVLEHGHNINPDSNPFNYLTTMILNQVKKSARKSSRYRAMLKRYQAHIEALGE